MNGMYFDIQRFSDNNSSIDSLERLGNVINALDLKNLADEFLNSGKTVTKFLKDNVNPILKFIGTFLEAKAEKKSDTAKKFENYSTVITSTAIIVDSALAVVKYAKEKNTDKVPTNIGLIASELTKMVKAVVSLNSGSGKASLILGIVASTTSLVANGISALDGLDDNEKAEINKAYVELMKSFGPDLVKKIFNDAIASEIKKASVKDLEVVKKNISLFNNVSNTLTKAGGVLDLVFALTNGVMNGIDKYKVTLKKYTEDNIPEDMAKRDAFIDAITTVIHDTAHTYTKGLDDVLFRGTQTLVSWITGKQPGSQGNYVEVITDIFKAFNFTNSGTADGDYLLSFEDNMMIYGMDGNDYIGNIFSRVMIYGGHDNDTIVSRLGSGDGYSTPQGNSFFGGPGEDLFMVYDTSSTIDGGTDSDRIAILGKNNKIYGDNGTDAILLESGADGNTISGGLGDDAILLNNAKNTVIEYNEGDGNDIIIGYDESDEIHILANYSASINGQDVIIGVGNDSIILSGAAGKKININGTKQTIGSKPTNPPLIITLPSVWHENAKVIRGTNGKDTIRNTLIGVMIEALADNDSIRNIYGDSVSISGGKGDDSIYNESYTNDSYTNYVTIDGGAGNDYIYNNGNDVTIDSGTGNDSIRNIYGDSVNISGGEGDDSIYNDQKSAFVTIDGGAGNDSIRNTYEADNVSINGGAGNDYIYNNGNDVTINSSTGNDSIYNNGGNVIIEGGAGDDSISNYGTNVTIEGGAGDDSIANYGSDSTILGGAGNDEIYNAGANVLINYADGDGNDTIWGFNKTSTLKIIDSSYSSVKNGSDVIFTVGSGKIILKGAANLLGGAVITTLPDTTSTALNLNNTKNNSKIIGSSYDDTITNSGSNVTITSGIGGDSINNSGAKVLIDGDAGSDTIYNNGNNVTINGIDGDDDIYNYGDSVKINSGANYDLIMNYGSKVTVDGDTGNNFIYSNASDVSINAGDGFDTISNYGDGVTINGGKNNDTITNIGSSVRFKYASGDGNDLIEGFNETSTLQIGDGKSTYSFAVSEDDAIVTVGENKITLRGAASLSSIHINGAGSTVAPTPTGPLNLTNYTSYRTINGTSDNDSVWNEGYSVTINSAAGNDSIVNTGDNSSLNTGEGNDYANNFMSYYVTINSGEGSDTIKNVALAFTKINTGEDNDSIYSFSDYTTIIGGTGNDTISLNSEGGHNVIEYASGDGNDIIYDLASTDTLKITNGAWFSVANGNDVLVNVDSGTVTLSGAKGKTVNVDGKKLTFITVDDYATIEVEDLLSHLTNAMLYSSNINSSKNTALLTGTDYNDKIKNTGNTVFINVGLGQDSVYNTGYALIDVGQGNDTVTNYGNYSKILGGNGNDSIYNRANGVFIYGDEGNDNIYFSGQSSYILGGADNDSIYVTGSENSIYAGNGDDTITLTSSSTVTTIEGGVGDDVINNKGIGQTFLYTAGDGNDIITGFNNSSKLQIADGKGTYSMTKNASDIIVTVGEGKITLVGAASLSNVNIVGTKKVDNSWNLDGTRATYGNLITVSGVKSLDGLSLSGKVVTVSANALSTETVTINEGYTLALGNNVIQSTTTPAGWTLSGTTATYKNATTSAGYTLLDNQIIYTSASSGNTLVTVSGVKSLNGISLNNKVVTISNSALNKDTVTVSNGYTLALGNDVTKTSTANAGWNLSGSTATYKIASTSAGYKLEDNKISYMPASSGGILVTVNGVKSLNGLSLNNKVVTVSNSALNQKTVTISNGYTLALGNDVPKATFNEIAWTLNRNTATLTQRQSIGYVCNGSSITYSNKAATVTLANLTGVQSTDGLSVDGNVITLSKDVLSSATVKLTKGDYKLALDDDVITEPTTEPTWFISGTKATYKDGNSSYYSLALNGKSVNFVKATADKKAKDLITLNGVNKNFSADDIEIDEDNQIIILSNSALDKKTVTIAGSENYSLALGDDVKEATVSEPQWAIKNTIATLSQKQSVGYVCNGGSITYSSKAATATLATLTGVQSIDGLSVDGNVITLSEDALGSATVKLTKGDYKLALDDDVATSPTTEPTWFISGTKATYKNGNSAYYSLASNGKSISFIKAAADKKAKDLITLNGVSKNFSADDIEIDEDNQIVTLSNSALDKKTVTIAGSEDYSLALGDDVKEATVSEPQWAIKKTTATLSQKQSVGYVCNGGSITYSSKAATATLATLTGVQSIDGLSVDGNVITLSEDALGSATVKLTKGNYKLELDNDVATEPTTEPTWFISGTKATYKDGNSAYYSLASNGKSISFIKAAADKKAKDLITLNGVSKNFSADDIEIDEDNQIVTLSNSALDKKNVTIGGSENYSLALGDNVIEPELGNPKLEVKGSKASLTQSTSIGYVLTNDKTITYLKKVSTNTLATVTGVKSKSGISFDESSITLSNSALTNKVTVSGDVSFEFKANYKNASITGSKDDDVISVLGTGASVTGGKGDDYLTSGGGNTFIYASGDGDDVIADFTSKDKLKITSGDFTVGTDGSNVIVFVTKGKVSGSITLSDVVAGQAITILDNKNKEHLYFSSVSDYWFDENSFDTKSDISTIANSSDTNCQVGALNNLSEMNHKLNSFDSFSDKEKYFVACTDKP